ncbi:MAG: transglutaminase domain protein, partial [Acidobacteria bacterium]|nr:transglutaminase domain protein [Acidobacteriota bacterium]
LAKGYSEIVDKQLAGAEMDKIVRDAVGTSVKRDEIIAKLLAAVQKDVRYAGVEVGEGSIVPRPPKEVLANKYGDCKDKATLLVSMLRHAGLPASVALLRAGADLDVNADLPGLGQFNHAIVYVEGSSPMWVDPTDEFSPAGTVPVQDQGRLALIANPRTTALTQVPLSDSSANRSLESRTFTLSEEGKAAVVEVTEASGADDSGQRRYAASVERKKYREGAETYVKGQYSAEALESVESTDPRDLSVPFKVTIKVAKAGRGSTGGGEAAVALFPPALLESLPWSLRQFDEEQKASAAATATKPVKKRQHDFVFNVPYVREWHYRIVPPPGYTPLTLPPNETTALGSAKLTREFSTDASGAIVAVLRFDSGKRRLTPAEYEEMRTAIRPLMESKAVIVGFEQIGQARLNAGDVAGALAELRKLAALHPTEARHHVEIARAFLAGGMGEAARAEIARAIEIEPTSAQAQRTLGVILQTDLFGRQYRKGWNLAGALAAYHQAKELDPKDADIRGEYAMLLEMGEDGVRFGRNARLADSITELEALIDQEKEYRFEGELLLVLAHARRFADMKERARQVQDPQQREMGRVVAIAALEGSEAAIREARTVDQAARKPLLGAAGQTLMALRFYPQAADLFDQAAQGAANAADTRALVNSLRKAKPLDQMPLVETDPKSVIFKTALAAAANPDDPRPLIKLFAADEAPLLGDDNQDPDDGSSRALAGMRISAAQAGLPLLVLADLSYAGADFIQDGNDKSGYRIRMRVSNNSSETPTGETFYVIKENGRYVLGAVRNEPALIGWSALRFADAGDLDSARQWLNWARDEVSIAGGDDPMRGPAFAVMWPKNKQSATVEEIRAAAASLMFSKPFAPKAIATLLSVREKLPEEQRKWIDSALAGSYSVSRDWTNLTAVSRRLLTAFPDSGNAFSTLCAGLAEGGNSKEAGALANARLAKVPNDPDALRVLARVSMYDADYTSCDRYYRKLIEQSATPSSGDYNNVAWNALFMRSDYDRAIQDARRASALPGGGASSLHTLAALLAETGKSLEAREALLKSMDDAGRNDPAPHDWYVLGRIAENYGATDAAV